MLLLLELSSCSSCSNKKEQPVGPPPTQFEQGMTAKDTAAVKALVDKFFKLSSTSRFEIV